MEPSEFKHVVNRTSEIEVVRRHIIFGGCAVIDSDMYYALRSAVAEKFEIHPNSIVVVGSAKLGFSIAPTKRFREFGDQSDIDVAIVAPILFDRIWREVFEYKSTSAYWPEMKDFFRVLGDGWIRPDKLPRSKPFAMRNEWFEFFRNLVVDTEFGRIRVRAGLYKDWYFLEKYQSIAVAGCRTSS